MNVEHILNALHTACLGRGVNKGRVPPRELRPFADRKWIERIRNKGHKEAVQNILAEREKKNLMGRKNQASMSAYFGAKKKKDKNDSTSTVAAGTAATEVVDLSIPRPSSCADVYNDSSGKKKAVVSIYSK